jgi:hypothetical protein
MGYGAEGGATGGVDREVHATAGREAGATGSWVGEAGGRLIQNKKTTAGPSTPLRFAQDDELMGIVLSHPFHHPNDEDLSFHPSEQQSLAGGPESLGAPIPQRTRMSKTIDHLWESGSWASEFSIPRSQNRDLGHPIIRGMVKNLPAALLITNKSLWHDWILLPRSQNRDLGHPIICRMVGRGRPASQFPGLKIETWGTHSFVGWSKTCPPYC